MKYADTEDATLVLLTLAGEEAAYERLVIRHQKAVIAAAGAVTHRYGLAEDAAQDAFVTAWMKLNLLKEPAKFRSWVCRIAENCARRMVVRYREYVPLDELTEYLPDVGADANPAYAYEKKEEKEELYACIGRLPERVQLIIRMYYAEGKPVGEIAAQLGVSIGTVKSQLFDGRQKLRKDLGAMDEQKNDTLTERVMRKVEELKKWQYKSEKTGFEAVYRDVLDEVERLPESKRKNSALADVLLRGWWWIPGEQNDALFARIKEAALAGKNEEVMRAVVTRESEKLWGDARAEWLRDTAIPELEKNGFKSAVGDTWMLLARTFAFEYRKSEAQMLDACRKAGENLPANAPGARLAAAVPGVLALAKSYDDRKISPHRYDVRAYVAELRLDDGEPRFWEDRIFGFGEMEAWDRTACAILSNAAKYDGCFTLPGLTVGENCREKLYYTDDNAAVDTPAGHFTGCRVWTFRENFKKFITYYKEGVGIVRQDSVRDGFRTTYLLTDYAVKGSGLLPLTRGNEWHYALESDTSSLRSELSLAVEHNEGGKILLSGCADSARGEYNENSWEDMIQAITNEYFAQENGTEKILDMSHYLARAEALAATPAQKAHTAAAASVMRRLMEAEPALHPDTRRHTLWNFFRREVLGHKNRTLMFSDYNSRWSFEWKNYENTIQMRVLLNNFIYDILKENAHALWNDAWTDGYTEELQHIPYDNVCIRTKLACSACGKVSVPAGTFGSCLKITLEVSGYDAGMEYRNGVQEYVFAPGVGLVSATADVQNVSAKSVYLLTEYAGTGEGYMPVGEGFFRRYEAQCLTDGYVGWTEYTMAKSDEEDALLLFSNQCGYREDPPAITSCSALLGEQKEQKLYGENRIPEAQQVGKINDLKLLLHFFFRSRNLTGDGAFAASYMLMQAETMRALGGGEVPDALVGAYARKMLSCGAACMSAGKFEDGFRCLDESFAAIRKWQTFADGALLSVGADPVYRDVRMVKGKPILVLPDGTREMAEASEWQLVTDKGLPYYGMTHPDIWAWFRPVIDHPAFGTRFAEYVEKAKKLAEE